MPNTVGPEDGEIRILVIGKKGHGKSTVANEVIGSQKFGGESTDEESMYAEISKNGKTVKVRDTPDISEPEWKKKQKQEEVDVWKKNLGSDIQVILLAIKSDAEYTEDDFRLFRQVRRFWGGRGWARGKLIPVFTFSEGQNVSEVGSRMFEQSPKWIGKLLRISGGRFIVYKGQGSGNLADDVLKENDDDSEDEDVPEGEEGEVEVAEPDEDEKRREKRKARRRKRAQQCKGKHRKPKGGRGRLLGLGQGQGRSGGGGGGLMGCCCQLLGCF